MIELLAKSIFEKEKKYLLKGLSSNQKPLAIILGGQPASGKSNLVTIAKSKNPDKKFLVVNGDIYREFHPDYEALKLFPDRFSSETQIFSNVFTEGLINEALKNRLNIIVEGTMRNPQIPLQTSLKFKNEGYKVEAFAISAPSIFTEIGLYSRYQEEINYQGWGRLADLQSHNEAVKGISLSLDMLYNKKAIDNISLYTYQGKKFIESFKLIDSNWDVKILPSIYIEETRKLQLEKKEQIQNIIDRGNITYKEITPSLKDKIDSLLTKLEDILVDLDKQNKRGFTR